MRRNCRAPCQILELRDFLLDHLHPVGGHQLFLAIDRRGRRRRGRDRLDHRLHRLWHVRPVDGADRLGLPTAGGLYHWGSILGNRFIGWLTAWLNLLGLITVLGAINIGTAFYFQGTFGALFGFTGRCRPDRGVRDRHHRRAGAVQPSGDQGHHLPDRYLWLYHLPAPPRCWCWPASSLRRISTVTRLWTFTNYSGDAGGGVFPQIGQHGLHVPALPVAAGLYDHRL